MTIINQGEAILIIKKVARISNSVKRKSFKDNGIFSSMISMSCLLNNYKVLHYSIILTLEKRFNILPSGVVSKNDMGERSILFNSESWIFLDALRAPITKANAVPITAMICTTPNTP